MLRYHPSNFFAAKFAPFLPYTVINKPLKTISVLFADSNFFYNFTVLHISRVAELPNKNRNNRKIIFNWPKDSLSHLISIWRHAVWRPRTFFSNKTSTNIFSSSSTWIFRKTCQNIRKSQREQIKPLPSIAATSTKKFFFSSIANNSFRFQSCRINFYKSTMHYSKK